MYSLYSFHLAGYPISSRTHSNHYQPTGQVFSWKMQFSNIWEIDWLTSAYTCNFWAVGWFLGWEGVTKNANSFPTPQRKPIRARLCGILRDGIVTTKGVESCDSSSSIRQIMFHFLVSVFGRRSFLIKNVGRKSLKETNLRPQTPLTTHRRRHHACKGLYNFHQTFLWFMRFDKSFSFQLRE